MAHFLWHCWRSMRRAPFAASCARSLAVIPSRSARVRRRAEARAAPRTYVPACLLMTHTHTSRRQTPQAVRNGSISQRRAKALALAISPWKCNPACVLAGALPSPTYVYTIGGARRSGAGRRRRRGLRQPRQPRKQSGRPRARVARRCPASPHNGTRRHTRNRTRPTRTFSWI